MPEGIIESLDHQARGITRLDGKTVFVEDALPGETVRYMIYNKKPTFDLARVEKILEPSNDRIEPKCPHFGLCGGCSMQHFDARAQVAAKQRILEDNLWHLGKVKAESLFAPIYGNFWGYRYRARLSVRRVVKKGCVLVGFHEKKSRYVADMMQCEVLPRDISLLLLPLRDLIGSLSIHSALPQVELAIGEGMTVLVLRILESPTQDDEQKLREFADQHGIVFYLQPKGPATAYRFYPLDERMLHYRLPDFDIEHVFSPTEFTQVNHEINRVLVRRAMTLLDPRPQERIADMFCGLGNFTLPIARLGAEVVGIEGNAELVGRATENALHNGLEKQATYMTSNLFTMTPESLAALGHFDKMLIDPPREGAVDLVSALGEDSPRRIVYVSCNPATLARDAAILVQIKNYRLRGAGVVNMFPHTSHVESIALFDKQA